MRFLIIASSLLFFTLRADFYVITQHSQDTLLDYHQLARRYGDAENEKFFENQNLAEYRNELRKSKVFALPSTDTPVKLGQPKPGSTALSLNTEPSPAIQAVTFRLVHSNQSLPHKTFQCVDFDGELRWFVAPAFIPDSAFLFWAEPSFTNVFTYSLDNGIVLSVKKFPHIFWV